MAAAIEFWFDFISPYSYLAWTQIHKVAERFQRDVVLRPVLFAALLDHWGQRGPAEIPPKREHAFKQVLRRGFDLGVEISPPPAHPFNSLLGLRLATLELPAHDRRRLIDRLYAEVWAPKGRGITDPEAVAGVLDELGLDGAKLIAAANAPDNKQKLLSASSEAIGKGVFGVPTMLVDGELFWGIDDLPSLSRFLAGEDPIDVAMLERWRDLPVQSSRPKATRE